MTTTLEDALNRIVRIEKEIVAGADAVPYAFHTQESFPYWTNRIAQFTQELNSQDFYLRNYLIIARLVIGHATEGYTGALETTLQTTWIPQTLNYFAARLRLQNATDTTPMVDIDPRGQIIVSGSGLAVFDDGGLGVRQIGTEFNIELPILEQVNQAF